MYPLEPGPGDHDGVQHFNCFALVTPSLAQAAKSTVLPIICNAPLLHRGIFPFQDTTKTLAVSLTIPTEEIRLHNPSGLTSRARNIHNN